MEIPSYFKRYLGTIQPTKASRERAVQLHTTLRTRLEGDSPFQDVYRGSFIYGSYRRNTAIKQIKDVDVCVELDPRVLNQSPQSVVDRVRRVLERKGYTDKTALQRRSVRIDMSGTTLDVVPVVNGMESYGHYLIPDRKLETWIPTYPKEHIEAAKNQNKECNGRFIPLVKIVKAWFKFQSSGTERPKPKGFTLEALVLELYDKDAPSYAEAFTNFLQTIDTKYGDLLAAGYFPNVSDPSRPGIHLKIRISDAEAKRFGRIVRTSLAQARIALAFDTVSESAVAWRVVFGADFPVTPSSSTKTAEFTDGDEEIEEVSDDEISETEMPILPITVPKVRKYSPIRLYINAFLAKGAEEKPYKRYSSGGSALSKDSWVVFSIQQGVVSQPYEVAWIVENHGGEAKAAEDRGHERVGQDHTTRRHTLYRGSHTMICELRRNGIVLARGKHVVNVK